MVQWPSFYTVSSYLYPQFDQAICEPSFPQIPKQSESNLCQIPFLGGRGESHLLLDETAISSVLSNRNIYCQVLPFPTTTHFREIFSLHVHDGTSSPFPPFL